MNDIEVIKLKVEDSLNVVLSKALKSLKSKVALVFPEGNDVLNSPIGLQTLHQQFLKKKKVVISVVPKESYSKLVKESGFIVATTTTIYDDTLWQMAKNQVKKYVANNFAKNSVEDKSMGTSIQHNNINNNVQSKGDQISEKQNLDTKLHQNGNIKGIKTKKGEHNVDIQDNDRKTEDLQKSSDSNFVDTKGKVQMINTDFLRKPPIISSSSNSIKTSNNKQSITTDEFKVDTKISKQNKNDILKTDKVSISKVKSKILFKRVAGSNNIQSDNSMLHTESTMSSKIKNLKDKSQVSSNKTVLATSHTDKVRLRSDKLTQKTILDRSNLSTAMNRDKKLVHNVRQSLTGMDFGRVVKQEKRSFWQKLFKKQDKNIHTKVYEEELLTSRKPVVTPISNEHLGKIKKKSVSGFVKFIAIILLILIALGGGLFYIYYLYMPSIRVEIQVKSTKVPIKGKITGSSSSSSFDIDKKQIRVVKEVAEKEGSVNISATQKVTSGEYAKGVIRVLNTTDHDITLPAGTVFTTDGLKFKSVGEVTVPALSSVDVTVQATNYGEEYNIPAGKNFTISGVDEASSLTAQNLSAFTGGSKRVYTVLGKKDVESAVDDLKKALYAQALEDLENYRKEEGFVFIKESVKNELNGDYQLDKAIGTEMAEDEQAYLVVKTKSEAMYYSRTDLERLVEALLIREYKKMLNLPDNVELMVKNVDINVKKTTVSKDRKTVTIEFEATGYVTPKLTENDVIEKIKGTTWAELPEKLNSIKGLAKSPKIIFIPNWMPEFLRYVPSQDNRIDVSIRIVDDSD